MCLKSCSNCVVQELAPTFRSVGLENRPGWCFRKMVRCPGGEAESAGVIGAAAGMQDSRKALRSFPSWGHGVEAVTFIEC